MIPPEIPPVLPRSDAYPVQRDNEARRILNVPTAPGADADWLTPQELYGTDDPAELAAIRDRELEDYERWGAAPFDLE